MESWRAIPGFEGLYEISDAGRVRSLRFRNKQTDKPRLKVLRPASAPSKYARVCLRKGGRTYTYTIHRLVLISFTGVLLEGHDVAHLNGQPLDNRLENLVWATRSENELQKSLQGRWRRDSKLDPQKVIAIRGLFAEGKLPKEIALIYHVRPATIYDVIQHKTWKHVKTKE